MGDVKTRAQTMASLGCWGWEWVLLHKPELKMQLNTFSPKHCSHLIQTMLDPEKPLILFPGHILQLGLP